MVIELWIVIFLIFVGISTTLSYAYGFNRGQEFATNFVIDGLIEEGILEVIEEDE